MNKNHFSLPASAPISIRLAPHEIIACLLEDIRFIRRLFRFPSKINEAHGLIDLDRDMS